MKSLNLHGLQDYLALLVRRKWWVIVPFFALSGAVVVLTYMLPKLFVSEALILIPPRSVPKEFVRDPIVDTVDQRLTRIEQTVLSRTILLQILREFDDQLPEYRNLNMDARVLKLIKQIKIVFPAHKRADIPISYFRISYQNRSPELAQKIAAKLTALFIDQDNRNREQQVFGTTEFLTREIGKIEEEMKRSNEKLKELRSTRRNSLPDQLETNLRTLDRLQLQRQSNADALDRYATIRLNLERLLSETPPSLTATQASMNPAIAEYQRKLKEVKDLTATLKPTHPDVVAATLQLERLKQELPPEDLTALEQPDAAPAQSAETFAKTLLPNPVYQKLLSQLEEVKTEFESRERERTWIEGQIQKYNQWVQNSPQSEQEIAEISRENSDLNKQYEALRTSLTQAELSQSLESRQKGSQFVIADPANYPLLPTKPEKPLIVLAGVLLSLVAGLAFAVVADVANQKMWTQSDVEHLLGTTVLVEIPHIVTDSETALTKRKRRVVLASSAAAAAVYGVVLYLLYVNQGQVVQILDPLIQRFY